MSEKQNKPLSGLWRYNTEAPEGKYLVLRRDGSIPEWPNWVIGAKDPCAPAALLAYADKAQEIGLNTDYVRDVRRLAAEFERYRIEHGEGDPDRGKHRVDDPQIVALMRKGNNS